MQEASRTGEFFYFWKKFHLAFTSDGISRKKIPRLVRRFTEMVKLTHLDYSPSNVAAVVSVMDHAEGVSTAMSYILSRFKILPKTVYYENACNMSHPIVLRFPWMIERIRLLCERLHYLSHTCCNTFDPDSDEHKCSNAESQNRVLGYSKVHLRFVKGEIIRPFIGLDWVFEYEGSY